MATIEHFEDIKSWQKAREISKILGQWIDSGRFCKNYRLIHQIEGSSGSIMDNIAEGFERGTRAEFIQFLGYAKGSCGELRSQLYRASDRKYIDQSEFDQIRKLLIETSGLIQKLISYLLKSEVGGVRRKLAPETLNIKP